MKEWTGNHKTAYAIIGASNHTDGERQEDDYYATSPEAIDKLLTVEKPSDLIWECACGGGHLSERLKEYGYTVVSSDIKKRGYDVDFLCDFLSTERIDIFSNQKYDIITNPPYRWATEFVLKALELLDEGQKCYMFLKLTFLEGQARFDKLFSKYPPKTIYVFSKRIICAMNGEFEKYPSSAIAYGWYVFEKGFSGNTTVKWI